MDYDFDSEIKIERLKCGEIFLENQKFYFTCALCESIIEHKQEAFIEHLKIHHYALVYANQNKVGKFQQIDIKIEFTDQISEQAMDQIILNENNCTSKCFEDSKFDKSFGEIEYLEDDIKYYCPITDCKYEKNNKSDIFYHILEVHNLINRQGYLFECSICKLSQSKRDIVNRHLKIKHGILTTIKIEDTDDGQYKCSLCASIFCRKTNFNTHLRVFHKDFFNKLLVEQQEEYGRENLEFDNEFLKPNVSDDIEMKQNETIYVSENENDEGIVYSNKFYCQVDSCEETFNDAINIVNHMRKDHGFVKKLENMFQCLICHRKFSRNSIVKSHLQTQHGILMYLTIKSRANNKYDCNKCGNVYTRKNDYNAHLRIKHYPLFIELLLKQQQEFYEQFPHFAKIFKTTVIKYERVINDNNYHCDICIEEFSNIKLLINHLKTHIDSIKINLIKKKNMFCCPIKECQSLYKIKSEILIHILQHDLVKRNQSYYECLLCENKYAIKSLANTHLKEDHGISNLIISSFENLHICTKCDLKYKDKETLDLHVKQYHNEIDQNQSESDKIKIPETRKTIKSIEQNQNSETKLIKFSKRNDFWYCPECDNKNITKKNIIEHYNIEHDNILCTDCGFIQDSLDCITMHAKIKKFDYDKFIEISDIDGLWHCKLCEETKIKKQLMISHYRNKHRNSSICDICGKKLASPTSLVIHKRIHEEATFKCKYCPKSFQAEASYRFHTKIHLGQKDFKCTHCEKAFYRKYDLRMHEKMMHTKEKSHICDICGQSFYTSTRLKYHIRRHTGEKQFECELCNKFFYSNEARNKHKILHFDDRPFVCPLCGSNFKSKKNLRVHKQSHSTIEKYACPECGKCFAKYTSYYTHKKICISRHKLLHQSDDSFK